MTDPFTALPGEDAALTRLHHRLTAAAAVSAVLDVAYRTLDTPVGELLLAATSSGLVRVAFAVEGHDAVLARLAAEVSPRVLHAPARLDGAARELEEYFAGERTAFDVPVDLRLVRGFRAEVLGHLRGVDFGRTVSYARLAALTTSPRAVRAVGTACATNPLPLVVPCHRVLRSDGSVGQYLGGVEVKRALLDLEAGR